MSHRYGHLDLPQYVHSSDRSTRNQWFRHLMCYSRFLKFCSHGSVSVCSRVQVGTETCRCGDGGSQIPGLEVRTTETGPFTDTTRHTHETLHPEGYGRPSFVGVWTIDTVSCPWVIPPLELLSPSPPVVRIYTRTVLVFCVLTQQIRLLIGLQGTR